MSEEKEKLLRLVARCSKKIAIEYESVFLKAKKIHWDSYSNKGNINLDCLLMQVPAYERKYVIIHELAYRQEMNHSERFWKIVVDGLFDYQKAVKWLKKHGDSIIERL